jgi:hypothetical protein
MSTLDIPVATYLEKLSQDIGTTHLFEKTSQTQFVIHFEPPIIQIEKTPFGCLMSRRIESLGDDVKEELYAHLLFANFLGQGTGSSAICLESDMRSINIILLIDFEIDYKNFCLALEEFLNYSDFWGDEIAKKKIQL